jgi:holo-[acyl-carrier protein] synthase
MSVLAADLAPIWDADAAGPVEVGIDMIEIDRVRRAIERHPERFMERIYSPAERERYAGQVRQLATRFAAKEATLKALGTGIWNVRLSDIEVMSNERGKPILVLHGTALERARQLGLTHFAISLTHARGEAIAIVVASKAPRGDR